MCLFTKCYARVFYYFSLFLSLSLSLSLSSSLIESVFLETTSASERGRSRKASERFFIIS